MSYDPGQPPPYGYQQQPPPYEQPQHRGSGMAITALVLGIVALLSSWTIIGGVILGLAAVIVGFLASGRAKRGLAAGRGMAITGIILGVVSIAIAIALVAVGLSFLNSESGQTLQECVKEAGGDRAQVDQCERDFQRDVAN